MDKEICGELFTAPVGTPLPKGVDAKLTKAYKSAGYLTDTTMFLCESPYPEYTRVYIKYNVYDYKAILDTPRAWVIHLIYNDNTQKLIVIPQAQVISALWLDREYMEVTLKMFRDIKGITHYIYYPKEAGNEQ